MSAHFPYIIVGGGPAGTTTAEQLAIHKKKVLIIEKSPHKPYREKPCGGGLGPITIERFPYTRNQGVHTTKTIVLTMGKDSIKADVNIIMVDRSRFDAYLMERAMRSGAKALFNRSVKTVDLQNHQIMLDNRQQIKYDCIIGAGGITCPVKHALDFKVKTVPLLVGLGNNEEMNSSDTAEIVFFNGFKGYAWVFPKGTNLDVGIGGDAPVSKLKELFHNLITERNITMLKQTGWHIPFEVSTMEYPYGPHAILCGDAAGFVNPATGEGIRYAMQSGLEAAEVVLGKRSLSDYPSFLGLLKRLQSSRDKTIEKGIRQSFIEMKEIPELMEEIIAFYFKDQEKTMRKPLDEKEKLEVYKQISESISSATPPKDK